MTKKHISIVNKVKNNPWMFATFVLAVLVVVMMVTGLAGATKNASADTVGKNFVDFINSKGGTQIEFVSAKDFSADLYEVTVLANGQEVPAHITKDGKYFVQLVAPLDSNETSAPSTNQDKSATVPKTDKPEVELFVMSYCPYGTQAMKGMIPAIRALGDSVDFNLRFVNYAMHGEKEVKENVELYCIQKEQQSKLLDYLECYLGGTAGTDDEIAACRAKVGIDENKLDTCIKSTDDEFNVLAQMNTGSTYPKFLIDDALNTKYGVQGSPTLVINGVVSNAGRSPQSYVDAICSAFNNPEACGNISVSSDTPSPGFGYGTTSSGSTASCG